MTDIQNALLEQVVRSMNSMVEMLEKRADNPLTVASVRGSLKGLAETVEKIRTGELS